MIFDPEGEFPGDELTTHHERSFTAQPDSTYTFMLVSEDASGNRSEDGWWTITTPNCD